MSGFSRTGAPFNNLQTDFRNAVRLFARQPGFATVVVVTLGLGIAANTTVFTIVNVVVLPIIGGTTLLLLVVGIGACAIPGRRAVRLAPVEALRNE